MALIVQKFGGTSVGSTERIKNVAKRVARWKAQGHQLVVVPSAMSGETNRLIALAKEISPAARSARTRRGRLHRRAGHHRPVVDGADGTGREGEELHRRPGQGAHRQRVHQGAHRAHRREPHARRSRSRLRGGGRRLPGRGCGGQHHHARARRLRHLGGGAGGRAQGRRMPDLHRRRRRLHHRSAHRARGAAPGHHHLRGNARDGEPGLEGAADPLGRIRRQVQSETARAVLVRREGRPGHADYV